MDRVGMLVEGERKDASGEREGGGMLVEGERRYASGGREEGG